MGKSLGGGAIKIGCPKEGWNDKGNMLEMKGTSNKPNILANKLLTHERGHIIVKKGVWGENGVL